MARSIMARWVGRKSSWPKCSRRAPVNSSMSIHPYSRTTRRKASP
jgi:hypothetical protein